MSRPVSKEEGEETTGALARAVKLLDHLGNAPRPQTLRELSVVVGSSDSTVYRMLATLGKFNLVERDPLTRRYGVGAAATRLAEARRQHFGVLTYARPHLESLRDRTSETTSFYTFNGTDMVCIDRVDSPLEVRRVVSIGTTVSLTALGAMPKVMLAHLPPRRQAIFLDAVDWSKSRRSRAQIESEFPAIRKRGTARSFGERAPDIASLAAVVFNEQNQPSWVLVASGPSTRWDADGMDRIEAEFRAAALDISRAMDWKGERPLPKSRAPHGATRRRTTPSKE